MESTTIDIGLSAVQAAWQRAYAAGHDDAALPIEIPIVDATQRAGADARAAWRHWHDEHAAALFSARELPWYVVLERARTEVLAGRELRGMRSNLELVATLAPADEGARQLYIAARWIFDGGAATALQSRLPIVATLPSSFVQRMRDRLKRSAPRDDVDIESELVTTLQRATPLLHDAMRFAESIAPLVRAIAAMRELLPANKTGLARGARSPSTPDNPGQNPIHRIAPGAPRGAKGAGAQVDAAGVAPYSVFSRQWDEELLPRQLEVLLVDRPADSREENGNKNAARRLAHQLQRRLVAARLRRWDFDQEEGAIDNKRLSSLYTGSGNRRIFRQERESPVPEACVTLLVDQSGSMRGEPMRLTLDAIDFAVQALEACRISCEVLGYTTRFRGDNPLLQAWRDTGERPNPGRLNALRHVVYKTASQPWRRSRRYLALLRDQEPGGENIDGEALEWAVDRLRRRAEPRKILVVLSDGTPYDEATARANGRGFLEAHLRSAIACIEATTIHLAAIGAGQDVGRFYRHALTVRRPVDVSEILFGHLADLLTRPASDNRRAPT